MKELFLVVMISIVAVLCVCAKSVAVNQIALKRHNDCVRENAAQLEAFSRMAPRNDLL